MEDKLQKNIPEFKRELIEKLKTISTEQDFILGVGSCAGKTKDEASKVIKFIEEENPTKEDVIIFALGVNKKMW